MLDAIVNHLWQTTVFALAIGLLALLVRNNSASTRYWLWLAASIKFLTPLSLLMAIGSQVSWPTGTDTIINENGKNQWVPVIERFIEPVGNDEASATPFQAPAQRSIQNQNQGPDLSLVNSDQTSLTPSSSQAMSKAIFLLALIAIWSVGFCVVMIRWFSAWLKIKRTMNRALPFEELSDRNSLYPGPKFPTPVKVSQEIEVPGVFGIFNRTLLLPAAFLESLDEQSAKAIVAHEKMHISRNDNLTAALHMIVEALFWFHPLVWWIGKHLNEEREFACDEAVLKEGCDPKAYAEGILTLCQHSVSAPLLCAAGSSGNVLRSRIESIMSSTKIKGLSMVKKTMLVTFMAVALAGPILLGVVKTPSAYAAIENNSMANFENASLSKGFKDADRTGLSATSTAGLEAANWSMAYIIGYAYDVQVKQVVAPDWVKEEYLNISAFGGPVVTGRADEGPGHWEKNEVLVQEKLRNLLSKKFNLSAHKDKSYIPAYVLTAKTAVKGIEEAKAKDRGPSLQARPTGLKADRIRMEQLMRYLSRHLDRPIVDQTGLKGEYNFYLDFGAWAKGLLKPEPTFEQLQSGLNELGLSLDAKMDYVEVLEIDHIEQAPEIAIVRN